MGGGELPSTGYVQVLAGGGTVEFRAPSGSMMQELWAPVLEDQIMFSQESFYLHMNTCKSSRG